MVHLPVPILDMVRAKLVGGILGLLPDDERLRDSYQLALQNGLEYAFLLVCDPVAGLVEVPCSKRNATGTVNALICAEMALAGIESVIPFDEIVDAMFRVGRMMSPDLRETARGGCALTPTAQTISRNILSAL